MDPQHWLRIEREDHALASVPDSAFYFIPFSSNQGEFQTELIVFVDKGQYEAGSSGGMTVEAALQAGAQTIATSVIHYYHIFRFSEESVWSLNFFTSFLSFLPTKRLKHIIEVKLTAQFSLALYRKMGKIVAYCRIFVESFSCSHRSFSQFFLSALQSRYLGCADLGCF